MNPASLIVLMAALAGPLVAAAQSAPATWSTQQGRWNEWKGASFQNSTSHYEALKAAAKNGKKLTPMTVPDWTGLWTAADSLPGAFLGWSSIGLAYGWGVPVFSYNESEGLKVLPPGIPRQPPLPANTPWPERPVLTPEGEKALVVAVIQSSKGIAWDYTYECLPAGFPRWYTEPFLREFIPTPNQTWMINEFNSEVRRIYTDGRAHVPEADRYPFWEGDSIGFWDGDTLVVHTVSLKPGTWNRGEPHYSDQTETVELIRKNAQGLLEARMTVYDPVNLQKPWHLIFGSQKVDLTKTPDMRIHHFACTENNNYIKMEGGGVTSKLPNEETYRDPNELIVPPEKR